MIHLNRMLAVVAVAGLALFLASCGGSASAGSDASTSVAPTVAPSVQAPTPVAATSPTPAPSATATSTPASAPVTSSPTVATPASTPTMGSGGSPSAQQLLARGKVIFDKEAGGIGCQACHGLDGKGKVGLAPTIRGKNEGAVRIAIQGGVAMMSFIKLSDEDITAVVAYLQYLVMQP